MAHSAKNLDTLRSGRVPGYATPQQRRHKIRRLRSGDDGLRTGDRIRIYRSGRLTRLDTGHPYVNRLFGSVPK